MEKFSKQTEIGRGISPLCEKEFRGRTRTVRKAVLGTELLRVLNAQ